MADDNSIDDEKLLTTCKTLLKPRTVDDDLLSIIAESVKQSVKNYCRIDELPSALFYVLANMISDLYIEQTGKTSSGDVAGNVSSITEDGRSVSFSSNFQIEVDDRISRTKELNRFRRLFAL